MIREIPYDVYQEAKHRTRQDIRGEKGEIMNLLDHAEMTEAEYQEHLKRISELNKMLGVKDIEEADRRYEDERNKANNA